ncbi:MAG: glycosyltransferase [Phycisphaerae bacterium]|nr:glycosyltransferase [Phycisphaerae bacterium]
MKSDLRVLMLGWEFPPFISGGLGTACYGLTKALDRANIDVTFVLPKSVEESHASHVQLVSPKSAAHTRSVAAPAAPIPTGRQRIAPDTPDAPRTEAGDEFIVRMMPATEERRVLGNVEFVGLPGEFPSVYGGSEPAPLTPTTRELVERIRTEGGISVDRLRVLVASGAFGGRPINDIDATLLSVLPEAGPRDTANSAARDGVADYGGDLIGAADRYARFAVDACRDRTFDVIHAHDWLTYPAGLALQKLTGKPLIVHVHSTEFDRSGEHPNQQVYSIERRGMWGATRVIAVSMLTKNVCVNRYGVEADKIAVVYNGVDLDPKDYGIQPIHTKDRIVLYFGRITLQKGPEYFIRAAKRVLEVMSDVKFVVAGSGDQAARMIEMAAELGIGHKVLFTGFLRGKDIARVFALADVYVMPSVSEPFGIAPLEAISHNVPVLISKSSGVSEILMHALKVDFWDIEDMADKIVAVLRHPPLSRALRDGSMFEVRGITWDGAATQCLQTYHAAMAAAARR